MKRLFARLSKLVFNLLYKLACLMQSHRRDEVLFLSRQTNDPSYDFKELAREFEECGWKARIHVRKLSRRSIVPYTIHVLKEIVYLSQCKLVILDRYDPVVSLIDFKCEPVDPRDRREGIVHYEFPAEPVVIQIWHAFGAFKKFGYQSMGTAEGHTKEAFESFCIHRNYSWIICSGEGCKEAFAEAFSYPIERIVVARRPEYDKLIRLREELDRADRPTKEKQTVLFAPTLRKSDESEHPFRDLYENRAFLEKELDANLVWSFHPLESGLPAPGDVSEALLDADIVVTDYSSIIYEAYLLGKKTLFYVPDVECYRKTPGLNADPLELCPGASAGSLERIKELLVSALDGDYTWRQIKEFVSGSLAIHAEGITHIALGSWRNG